MPASAEALSGAEAAGLLAGLEASPGLVLAVSGGPDSTALLLLAARWRKALAAGPPLIAVTVDHGLRPEAAEEASAVKTLARALGIPHRTLRWQGEKPATGLPAAARAARYRLLAAAGRKAGAGHVVTAHTSDDQAETVLMRLVSGSGPAGLAGMAPLTPLDPDTGLPAASATGLVLARPLLAVPKARLIATVEAAGIGFATDPSNADPRFTRPRLRRLLAALAPEGLTAGRLAVLAARMRRAEEALERAATEAEASLRTTEDGRIRFDAAGFLALPDEIALRLLRRAIAAEGNEGPVELARLEALYGALAADGAAAGAAPARRFRRTLAGASVTLERGVVAVGRAPPRRGRAPEARKMFTRNDAVSADSLGIGRKGT